MKNPHPTIVFRFNLDQKSESIGPITNQKITSIPNSVNYASQKSTWISGLLSGENVFVNDDGLVVAYGEKASYLKRVHSNGNNPLLEVVEIEDVEILISVSDQLFMTGESVVISPIVSGGTVQQFSISGLPNGLFYDPQTGIIYGDLDCPIATYAVNVRAYVLSGNYGETNFNILVDGVPEIEGSGDTPA